MVIVEILGGLGNQLSAYACGYSIAKELGQELVLDISDYTQKGYFRPYCLDKLQIGAHRKLIYSPVSLGFMDIDGIPRELRSKGLRILRHEDYPTRELLLEAARGAKSVYLMGYGGLHYCTQEDKAEIKKQFQLKVPSTALAQFKQKIQQQFSVAVHVRRTDYVTLGCQASTEYYQAAITYVKIFYPGAHFYFFSDDINYVKEQFGPCTNYHYVHLLGGMDADLEEFFCISACNARILTRESSFSGWATELSFSKSRLNICQEHENLAHISYRSYHVYLNQTAIDTLSKHYQAENTAPEQGCVLSAVNDAIFRLVAEGRNDEALDAIDRLSFDSYGLSEENTKELTVFKTIALAQKGDSGLPAALRTFYMQMQTEHENPVFHANYFRALYQSGHVGESAIHAALANRFGDSEDYQPYFAQMEPFEQKLYQLLLTSPVRHFIFVPMEGWSFYTTYVKSLAVFLARMGQKISFFQPVAGMIEGNASDAAIATTLLQQATPADSVYRYHIDLVPYGQHKNGTGKLLGELIRQCARQFDLPAIAIVSHPGILSQSKVSGIKYAVPDISDPLNRERFYLESMRMSVEEYVTRMAGYSDAVFLSGDALAKAKKNFGARIRQAFPTWEGPSYQILVMESDITPNYIPFEQMLRNAAALLEI